MYQQLGRQNIERDAGDLQALMSPAAPHILHAEIYKDGIADAVATPIFTITTTDEAGANDGGAYLCIVRGLVTHSCLAAAGDKAAKAFEARLTRANLNSGPGVTTVTEHFDDTLAATNPAARTINDISLTVAETTEYINTVSITIDLAGAAVGGGEISATIELFWRGYLTPPAIAPA